MNVNIETSERRAAGHTPFSKSVPDSSLEFATADDIRSTFKAGAPQSAKNWARLFENAFNVIYDQPRHEPYREKVAEMVKEVARVNIEGTARAEFIFHGLNNSGVAKAISAANNGAQNPKLSELAISHKKLSESFEPLKKYVEALSKNPANSNRLMTLLPSSPNADNGRKRMELAGFNVA